MQTETIGPLRAHLIGGTDGHGAGRGPIVVLLHGFGAPGTDLVGLAEQLRVTDDARFVFPEAPTLVDVGLPPPYEGRAWWPIDMLRLQLAVQGGSFDGLARHVPDGLAHARQLLGDFLDALDDRLEAQGAPLVLGGFSQGAMLSSDLVLRSAREFAGLLILSGTLIASHEWTECLKTRSPVPFFQSHGTQDPVLPIALAERFRTLLTESGWRGDWVAFRGGHGIGLEALAGARAFLERVLA